MTLGGEGFRGGRKRTNVRKNYGNQKKTTGKKRIDGEGVYRTTRALGGEYLIGNKRVVKEKHIQYTTGELDSLGMQK